MKDLSVQVETKFEQVKDYLFDKLRTSNELPSLLAQFEDTMRARVEVVLVSDLNNILSHNALPGMQNSEHNKALAAQPERLEDLILWHMAFKCKSWPVEKEHGISKRTTWAEIWKYVIQKRVERLVRLGIELNQEQVQTLRVLSDIEKSLNA